MILKTSITLNVTGSSIEPTSITLEECSGCDELRDAEDMIHCLDCNSYVCPSCDCACHIFDEEASGQDEYPGLDKQ
jgi:hypothetical protein